jgi:ATP-dependent Clp protease ATP-binding subunit ClpC
VFERFTDKARRTIALAQDEARTLGHDEIGTEHLLLGLILEGKGVAARTIEALGASLDGFRADVESMIGRGTADASQQIPFSPRAKRVLELSLREALHLGHNYIGTEHILLGLSREGSGVAAQALLRRGLTHTRIRHQVAQVLNGPADSGASGVPSADEVVTRLESVLARLTIIEQRLTAPG